MAKKRNAARIRHSAADRAQGTGRGRKSGAQAKGFAAHQGAGGERMAGRGGQARRARQEEEEGGLWSGARDIAENVGQSARGIAKNVSDTTRGLAKNVSDTTRGIAKNVGDTTRGAAEATVETARGWAAGAADAAGSVVGKVRDNPWPSLLIGAGATWMAIDAIRGRAEEARDRADDRGRTARRGRGRNERGGVGQVVSKVAQAGRSAGEQVEEFVRDRPLLAGAATLGLGMAVGMALPSSVTENEVLGQARDSVVRRAKGAARETMEKVRDVTDTIERMGPFGRESTRRGSR